MVWMTSSREDSHSGRVRTLPLSHLVHSESQLETREVGQHMMMRRAKGVPPRASWPLFKRVQRRAMPWRVLPRLQNKRGGKEEEEEVKHHTNKITTVK